MPDGEKEVPASGSKKAHSKLSDEMHDSGKDLDHYRFLALPLRVCEKEITPKFDIADKASQTFQNWHRGCAITAIWSGTLAVLMAILELAYHDRLEAWTTLHRISVWLPSLVELGLAGLASLAALVGWFARFKQRWLRLRYQAERYRLLKFDLLSKPWRWEQTVENERWLSSKLAEVGGVNSGEALEEEARKPILKLDAITRSDVSPRVLHSLTEYYLKKRLEHQRNHFLDRAKRNETRDRVLKHVPHFLFFASVLAVIVQFCMNYFLLGKPENHVFTTVGAAMLPAVAAGFSTWRAAFEYSRNKNRFRSASANLIELDGRLSEGLSKPVPPGSCAPDLAHDILQEISWCEHLLIIEQMEWLRLMLETEWYG